MLGVKRLNDDFPGFSARPARPLTCVNNWKVRSLERKSGKFKAVSAFKTPTNVTFGKSSPLAIICVPNKISACPSPNVRKIFHVHLCDGSYQHPFGEYDCLVTTFVILLLLLCACSVVANFILATVRTAIRNPFFMSTIMTFHCFTIHMQS